MVASHFIVLGLCFGGLVFAEEQIFENVPGCTATREYEPVCASNGKSYSNKKIFGCAKEKEPDLTIVSEGACGGEDKTVAIDDRKVEAEGEPSGQSRITESLFAVICLLLMTLFVNENLNKK